MDKEKRGPSRLGFLAGLSGSIALATTRIDAATMEMVNQRPYDWSTPVHELGESLYTPVETFFIRSHMGPPTSIDMKTWHLAIDGMVERPLRLSFEDLKRFPQHEVPAVLQCSGNGRWYFGDAYADVSHPAGAQWRKGGIGNARWGGVRVRDVLNKAGIKSGAKFSTNYGLDNPILATTPKFIRGIELEKLLDEDTLLVYKMNGAPLPYYHGYPVRLIVPGWAGDHSVKWLSSMTLTDTLTDKFWTSVGYRYPNEIGAPGKGVKPTDEHPITAINVKSIITSPQKDANPRVGAPLKVTGFAWSGDGAYVTKMEVSVDGGRTWRPAILGPSPGKFSWRTFSFAFTPATAGTVRILARATDNKGATQPHVSPWNPGGYLWNAIDEVSLEVSNA